MLEYLDGERRCDGVGVAMALGNLRQQGGKIVATGRLAAMATANHDADGSIGAEYGESPRRDVSGVAVLLSPAGWAFHRTAGGQENE